MNPTFHAIKADFDPDVSVYAKRDRTGILIPRDWHPGFQVVDLALRLHDHVFGRIAIVGFGKQAYEGGFSSVAVCVNCDWIRAAFDPPLRGCLQTAPSRL